MVKLRLTRIGAKGKPAYRIIAADSRAPRDGAFLEILGHYNPLTDPETVTINKEKTMKWINTGAQPTETVERLLANAGIIEKKEKVYPVKPAKEETKAKGKKSKEEAPKAEAEKAVEEAPKAEAESAEPVAEAPEAVKEEKTADESPEAKAPEAAEEKAPAEAPKAEVENSADESPEAENTDAPAEAADKESENTETKETS